MLLFRQSAQLVSRFQPSHCDAGSEMTPWGCLDICPEGWSRGGSQCVAPFSCPEAWARVGNACIKPRLPRFRSGAAAVPPLCPLPNTLYDPASHSCLGVCAQDSMPLDLHCVPPCPPGMVDVGDRCTAPSTERVRTASVCDPSAVHVLGICIHRLACYALLGFSVLILFVGFSIQSHKTTLSSYLTKSAANSFLA